ncbi:fungal-specific transcription factor domain-containing protein [Plectosphaerella plurivora]|uniref:Fungal-specific transcription factor domain-containing protein n=1 Tax=Plectosphaerella plurivora TaxID=936078 RepID=A0A9P9ADU5_9PEZI|nr:fungal-specific transcription factor domain-containing protein [Plectosphaerella plurivora]
MSSLPSHASPASVVSQTSSHRKRSAGTLVTSPGVTPESGPNPRKAKKVSRACDYCKSKKLKCSGTFPCDGCKRRRLPCEYQTLYRRGKPPTPPPAQEELAAPDPGGNSTSRTSPELESAEIEGQYFDLTSSLTFLHRAWKRLSAQSGIGGAVPQVASGNEQHQNLFSAGDKPFVTTPGEYNPVLPNQNTAMQILRFYFDVCVITYRFLHQPQVTTWFNAVIANSQANVPLHYGIGHAKASIVMTIIAIVALRRGKIHGTAEGAEHGDIVILSSSDAFFCASKRLTDAEVGYPTLESAQARLLQVLYLLQSTRMNQAWFVFGSTLPIVSALGLHRRRRNVAAKGSPNFDYILFQCRKRTFWVAYTIDKYLAVVFGRPPLYHDEDINQDFPDCVNDEDMTPQGRATHEPAMDCHIDSLIFHAKVAQLIDRVSREVYSIKRIPHHERLAAAEKVGRALHEWKEALPYHLGTLRPMSLIPPFRRQAMALKLAYCHAIMHANRPFLLGTTVQQASSVPLQDSVNECINAARIALETVDAMSADGTLFHAFWWTPYVTFCALAVVYVWEIQQNRSATAPEEQGFNDLLELAERCQNHLAQATTPDSPSRRYNIILEELRQEAKYRSMRSQRSTGPLVTVEGVQVPFEGDGGLYGMNPLDDWQTTDWLDLDSSVSLISNPWNECALTPTPGFRALS